MKQTLPARLLAKFEKLDKLYTNGNGQSVSPTWLVNILNFLEDYISDSLIDMKQLANNWHRCYDSASHGNWADQMIHANEEFKNMNTTINA